MDRIANLTLPAGMQINAPLLAGYDTVLTPEALAFVTQLHRAFNGRRLDVLAARRARQARISPARHAPCATATGAFRPCPRRWNADVSRSPARSKPR